VNHFEMKSHPPMVLMFGPAKLKPIYKQTEAQLARGRNGRNSCTILLSRTCLHVHFTWSLSESKVVHVPYGKQPFRGLQNRWQQQFQAGNQIT